MRCLINGINLTAASFLLSLFFGRNVTEFGFSSSLAGSESPASEAEMRLCEELGQITTGFRPTGI